MVSDDWRKKFRPPVHWPGKTDKYRRCGNAELAEEKPLEICFSHVSFSHPGGDKRILDDVSFTLHAGEHTALVGINGAGKSTIVKLI